VSLQRWLLRQAIRHRVVIPALIVLMLALIAWSTVPGVMDRWQHHRQVVRFDSAAGPTSLNVINESGDSHEVALLGVRVPTGQHDQAMRWLAETCTGRTGMVVMDGPDHRDDGGRVLALLYRDDGLLVNLEMITAGRAEADGRIPHRLDRWFGRCMQWAQRDGQGMWAPKSAESVGAQ
jgi:endonuclease YncB( thermonuclease family)